TVQDIDGNVYHTVTIGTQVWMVENLKTTKYNDGSTIPNVIENTNWYSRTTDAYCWYNNEISNKDTYGALYNWYSVGTYKLAPKGWHVPTEEEWIVLINYLGGLTIAGGKLKETGIAHWKSPNAEAVNEYGFTALPGGKRFSYGTFSDFGKNCYWWTSIQTSMDGSNFRGIGFDSGGIVYGGSKLNDGFSVRCIRD
ncbi:MAG: fibrobacter succinogenes major paralogous domain-containing protein, partial [Bacteroidota bacterium]|nr:fibrobacter succinogenes major paralogous domain-containing protein [Bacteroidota bacterium]